MKLTTLSSSMRLAMTGMVLVSACAATPYALALGLGQAKVLSSIGESLVADIELLTQTSELATLKMSLAPASEYQLQGIEFNPALVGARVTVKKGEDGKSVAQIVTNSSIRDSYVQVIVDGDTAAGKVRRAYSLFIDPNKRTTTRLPGEGSLSELVRPVAALPLIKGHQAEPTATAQQLPPGPLVKLAPVLSGNRDDASEPVLTNVTQNGTAPQRLELVKGGGQNQPIQRALFSIVPKGWKGYATDPAVKLSGFADWQGNRDWLTVLDGVLSSAQLMATVHWDKKEVVFSSISAQSATRPSIASLTPSAPVPAVPAVPASIADDKTPRPGSATEISRQHVQLHGMANELATAKASMESVKAELLQARLALTDLGRTSGIGAQALAKEIGMLKEKQQELQKSLKTSQAALAAEQVNEASAGKLRTIDDQAVAQRHAAVKSELEAVKLRALEFEDNMKTALARASHHGAQVKGLEAALVRSEARLEALTAEAKTDKNKVLSADADAKRLAEENNSLRQALAKANDELALSRKVQLDFNAKQGN